MAYKIKLKDSTLVLKEIPEERFKEEQKFLLPLTKLYPAYYLDSRKVREDGKIVYNNKCYDISQNLKGKTVNIENTGDMLNIYHKDKQIKSQMIANVFKRPLSDYEEVI